MISIRRTCPMRSAPFDFLVNIWNYLMFIWILSSLIWLNSPKTWPIQTYHMLNQTSATIHIWLLQCSLFEIMKVVLCDLNRRPFSVMPSSTVLIFETIRYIKWDAKQWHRYFYVLTHAISSLIKSDSFSLVNLFNKWHPLGQTYWEISNVYK